MEIITIESEAFKKLNDRITTLLSWLEKCPALQKHESQWLTNAQFCKYLSISKRTSQSYRNKKLIRFSQNGSKIYYKLTDVDAFLQNHHIKSNPK